MPENTKTVKETTDLIDVSDIEEQYDDVTPVHTRNPISEDTEREAPLAISEEAPAKQVGGLELAPVKSRFAAFMIDSMILYVVYWFMMIAYRGIALGNAAGPVPVAGIHGIIFHSLVLLIFFVYFFLLEAIFFATPGKLFCRLRVCSMSGKRPSMGSILLRNLLRPLDLVLFPLLITVAMMEWTRMHQRLGDLIGRTIVVVTRSAPRAQVPVTAAMLPGAAVRIMSFVVDLALFLVFFAGYLLILNPDQPLVSMLLVVISPVVALLFFMLPEAAMGTSVGKWFFGCMVLGEDGSRVGVSRSFIRSLFLPLDITPFGFAATLFSPRHQRIGDNAAGTVVARRPRHMNHLIGLVVVILVVTSVAYAGFQNPNNVMSRNFQVNFLPALDVSATGGTVSGSRSRKSAIGIISFAFAGGSPDETRQPAIFKPGETVYLVFSVIGGTEKDDKVWLQEDLTVRYPDNSTGLSLDNIIDFHQKLDKAGPVEMTNNIALPDDAQPGRYTVSIVVRDNNSGRHLNEQRFFYVSPERKDVRKPPVKQPAN